MKKVNFFIIGAPKCGTTSLYEYLSTHHGVCFSDSKEPHYFSHDFPGYCTTRSLEEYHQKEFKHCNSETAILGEASVWYLYSKVAVKEISEYNPKAKIIVMLRNPLDMMHSLHSQLLYNLDEDVPIFEDAWDLQNVRAEQKQIPKRCRVPDFLQYRNVGAYSPQLARVYDVFPAEQVKIILFDDLIDNPLSIYLDVLKFLGLKDDGRRDFRAVNKNKSLKNETFAAFVQRPPKFIVTIVKVLKKIFGIHRFGVYPMLNKLNIMFNSKELARVPLKSSFRKKMLDAIGNDIDKTGLLISKDLDSWKK